MALDAKPRHLQPDYAAQFGDASIVAAYPARPPYPDDVFETLASLAGSSPRRVLELGAGSGDVTFGLAPLVDHIDAVEPSAAMIEAARRRSTRGAPHITWIAETAEAFQPALPYSLAIAAESLHWMDWTTVLPKVARSLRPGGLLAIVTERRITGLPWLPRLRQIVQRFSTNKDYRDYDIVDDVASRGLFREVGREAMVMDSFTQSLDQYVESFHSRNGFSRERMSPEAASSFGAEVRALVLSHRSDGLVSGAVRTTVVWGNPGP